MRVLCSVDRPKWGRTLVTAAQCITALSSSHAPRQPHSMGRATRLRNVHETVWAKRVWPLLAGMVAGIGMISAAQRSGFSLALLISLTLAILTVTLLFGVTRELRVTPRRLIWSGVAVTATAMALHGLFQWFGGYGIVAALLTGATSPGAIALTQRMCAMGVRHEEAFPWHGTTRDALDVDRRFDEIAQRIQRMDGSPDA